MVNLTSIPLASTKIPLSGGTTPFGTLPTPVIPGLSLPVSSVGALYAANLPPLSSTSPFNGSYLPLPQNITAGSIPVGSELTEIKVEVYIEGVQIPFVSVFLREAMGELPSCTIEIPPSPNWLLLDQSYYPKVHIFVNGFMKFYGYVSAVGYSRTAMSANTMLTCVHRFTHMQEIAQKYSGATNIGGNQDATGTAPFTNLSTALLNAFEGLEPGVPPPTPNSIPPAGDTSIFRGVGSNYQSYLNNRWLGIPGVLINYWNQAKVSSFQKTSIAQAMTELYIPLVENGLQFFQTLSGHPYLEALASQSPSMHCGKKLYTPPTRQGFTMSSSKSVLSLLPSTLNLSFSNEMHSVFSVYKQILGDVDYSMEVLSMPVSWASYGVDPIETVVHPIMPLYYSPSCNVVYPNMLIRTDINFDNWNMPTRFVGVANMALGEAESPTNPGLLIRSPASVRQAVAAQAAAKSGTPGVGNLAHTLQRSYDAVGAHELGTGIRPFFFQIPQWMVWIFEQENGQYIADSTEIQTNYTKTMENMWAQIYPNAPPSLNPWNLSANGLSTTYPQNAYVLSSLFAYADYMYALSCLSSKTARVECLFNPYIIPGYPMDVLDSSPYGTSFHGSVDAVQHSLTPTSAVTSIELSSVMTYEELGQYFYPALQPWLAYALGIAGFPSLVNNPKGVQIANQFYYQVFGVGCIPPEALYDFTSNTAKDYGNISSYSELLSVQRPCMTLKEAEAQYSLTFISLDRQLSGQSNYATGAYVQTSGALFEFSQSKFLTYPTTGICNYGSASQSTTTSI